MLKIGVVGVGHLGQHHARVLNEIENCKLNWSCWSWPFRTASCKSFK